MLPTGLTGLDSAASWRDRTSDGWVYGYGTFCLVACQSRLLGACKGRRNRAHDATRVWLETGKRKGLMTTVLMDGKADDQARFSQMQRQRRILLLTTTRKGTDKSPARKRMIKVLTQRKQKR